MHCQYVDVLFPPFDFKPEPKINVANKPKQFQ